MNEDTSELVCWNTDPALIWLAWRLLKYPMDVTSLRSFTWNVEVSRVVLSHSRWLSGSGTLTLHPSSPRHTSLRQPSRHQVILLESPCSNSKTHRKSWTPSPDLRFSLSIQSQSAWGWEKKIYDGLKQKELKSPQGLGHTSKDTGFILYEHEIIILWVLFYALSRVFGPYLLLIISHFLQHTWLYLTSKCWINRHLPSIFFYILVTSVTFNQIYCLFTLQISNRGDLASAVSANKVLLKEVMCGINKGWNTVQEGK